MKDINNIIVHACTRSDYNRAKEKGKYSPDTINLVGYIHCSEIDTILRVANSNWVGRNDLILLFIDKDKVISEIKYEPDSYSGILYPHIYGSLNLDAIISVKDFLPKDDGTFDKSSILRNN